VEGSGGMSTASRAAIKSSSVVGKKRGRVAADSDGDGSFSEEGDGESEAPGPGKGGKARVEHLQDLVLLRRGRLSVSPVTDSEWSFLMALAAQQSLLDELMGKGRNAAKGEKVHQYRFDDPNVCKFMLVDYCPHDLFVNTRQDLGPCDKVHEISLQQEYRKSSRYGKLGYEEEFERFLKSLLSDVERRIKRGQDRLRLTQGDSNIDNDPINTKNETSNIIKQLTEKITAHVLKSEELGNACRIDEAQQILNECETMREEKKKLEMQLAEEQTNAEMMKAMEVCTVCGSFLIVGDAQSRLDEHINGKQHVGYAKIRSTLDELAQRKTQQLEKERARVVHKQEQSSSNDRKRDRSDSKDEKSKDEKSKRHHSPSSHHHHHRDRHSSREKNDHHHHHRRSSRYDNDSKERSSPSNHHHQQQHHYGNQRSKESNK